jgi:hypothetical protein
MQSTNISKERLEGFVTLGLLWPLAGLIFLWCSRLTAVVAEKLKSKQQDRLVVWTLLHEARLEMEDLCSLEVVKINRSQNNVAHELAHFAIRSSHSQVFFASFPEFVLSLVCNDTT